MKHIILEMKQKIFAIIAIMKGEPTCYKVDFNGSFAVEKDGRITLVSCNINMPFNLKIRRNLKN